MEVVIHQCKGIYLPCFFLAQYGYPVKKIYSIAIFPKYRCFFYPPTHHMVQCSRGIESRLPWHTAFV